MFNSDLYVVEEITVTGRSWKLALSMVSIGSRPKKRSK